MTTRAGLAIDATTARFLVTGCSAAALFFVLSFAALRAGLPPFAATLGVSAVTVAASYTVQQAWTFQGRARHTEAFPRYLAVQVGCALLSAAVARTLKVEAGLAPLTVAVATTLLSSAISYALSRLWVFTPRD